MKFKRITCIVTGLALALFSGCKDDTSSPSETSSNMVKVGSYNTPDYSYDVSIFTQGLQSYALIADGNSGLQIVNISSPAAPVFVSNYNTPGTAIAVTTAEINGLRFAFVSDALQGLAIINASNLQSPVLDTTLIFQNDRVWTSFVDAANEVLYIGTFNGNIYIYDVSNLPNSVSMLAPYTSPLDRIMGIYITDGIAYVAEGNLGLELINVSNPSNPQNISYYDTPGFSFDVTVGGNYAYVADESSLQVINISNPFDPVFAGTTSRQNATYVGVALNFPSQIYTADYDFGVETIGISSPASPSQLGYYNTESYAINLAYFSGNVYVADGFDGLIIVKYQ